MNREQKAAAIDEIASEIEAADSVLAVDYRGISVAQAAELRGKLRGVNTTLRVVKNSLTQRAAERAGASPLTELLQGPTALAFVHGDAALAAKALAEAARTTQLLPFKGGMISGQAMSVEQITTIARLPARDVLHGQLVGLIASPVVSLARTLNALIGGLAVALGGILEQKGAEAPAQAEAPAEAPAEPDAAADAEAVAEPEAEAAAEPEAEVAAEPEAKVEAEAAAESEAEAVPEAEAKAEAEAEAAPKAEGEAPTTEPAAEAQASEPEELSEESPKEES